MWCAAESDMVQNILGQPTGRGAVDAVQQIMLGEGASCRAF